MSNARRTFEMSDDLAPFTPNAMNQACSEPITCSGCILKLANQVPPPDNSIAV